MELQARIVLDEMYSATELAGISIDPLVKISPAQGEQINKLMRGMGAERSLEIGFAYGYSTIWMLDAVKTKHVAIDPFEVSDWNGIGLRQVSKLDTDKFEWIED